MPSHSYSKQQSILIQRKKEKNTYIHRYRKNSEPFSLSTKSLATYINVFVIYINVSIPQSISYNIILRNANTLFHIMQVVRSGVTRKAHKQDDSLFYLRGVDKYKQTPNAYKRTTGYRLTTRGRQHLVRVSMPIGFGGRKSSYFHCRHDCSLCLARGRIGVAVFENAILSWSSC